MKSIVSAFAYAAVLSFAVGASAQTARPVQTFQTSKGPVKITPVYHASLEIEAGGKVIIIDPAKPANFSGLPQADLVLITDIHGDHMDPDLIRQIVDRNQAAVYAHAEIVAKLREKDVPATEFSSGTRKIGSFQVRAIPAPHEAILSPTLPANTAYLVNERLLHPGDSYAAALRDFRAVPLFALPITAPWTTEIGTAAFADELAPKRILPIHDGYVKQFFLASRHQALGKHFEERGIAYAPADEPGAFAEV